ncbi:hypothetical protein L228DRAFT_251239 [Xylona heveae TC161]|uniref:Uncharacterized protein n=1 Tax=Xylona heveae (strain CBS 132557 / TC161) TaxID=1328760 RepID=A0A164ZIN3_XYLHT|nr:hypothetical protein L228DRAFT_251239 [Xylona heveae TC161]KZF19146.1 hypothetical protein L228DRAFT_251239 [Xylona heveae TC161]
MSTITNELFYQPPPIATSGKDDNHTYHIFFITGNPGLIKYYHGFLAELSKLLSGSTDPSSPSSKAHISKKNRHHVFGASLPGFETFPCQSQPNPGRRETSDSQKHDKPPYSLKRVIELVESRLMAYAQEQKSTSISAASSSAPESVTTSSSKPSTQSSPSNLPEASKSPLKVILVGHSVGSYILLEILRRHKAAQPAGIDIVGGILLFPTVTHIAKSPSGVKIGSVLQLQYFALFADLFVRLLSWLIPHSILYIFVKLATGFPKDAARTTLEFLCSPAGVREALHMSRDEMNEITEDRWDADVWGASVPGAERDPARLVFYFGQNDHWVADHTRDDLIAARAANSARGDRQWPKMMIDEDGIPHSFPIRHSSLVAEKVKAFIEAIIRDEQKAALPPDEENIEAPWMVSRSWLYL